MLVRGRPGTWLAGRALRSAHVVRFPLGLRLRGHQPWQVLGKVVGSKQGVLRQRVAVHALCVAQHHAGLRQLGEQKVVQARKGRVHPRQAAQLRPDGLQVAGGAASGGSSVTRDGATGRMLLLWCGECGECPGSAGLWCVALRCWCSAVVCAGAAQCVQEEAGQAAPALMWPHLDVVAVACILARAAGEQHVDGGPVLLGQAGEVLQRLPHFDHPGAFWQLLQHLRGRHTAGLLRALAV